MIEVEVTGAQVERAKELYNFGILKNSIMKGKSNKYGAIGEILVYDYFAPSYPIDFTSTFNYDMIINGFTVDVKTKRTTVTPKPYYYCSVSNDSTHQQCDMLFFVRVMENLSKAWLLGSIDRLDFYQQATFKRKGELDSNGWKFKADCYNLEIDKLNHTL